MIWRLTAPDRCAEIDADDWPGAVDAALSLLGWEDAVGRVRVTVNRGGITEVWEPKRGVNLVIEPVGEIMLSGQPAVY